MDQGLIQQMQHKLIFLDGRWERLPLCGKMGNIGSEVSRACRWKDKGNEERMLQALWRGLELFDVTIDLTSGPRRRELCRAREVFCEYISGDNVYRITEGEFLQYFDAFAMAYNMHRLHN